MSTDKDAKSHDKDTKAQDKDTKAHDKDTKAHDKESKQEAKSHDKDSKSEKGAKSHEKEKNALELLKADHKKVAELFDEYEQTNAENKKKQLAADICTALTLHAQVEEEMFYPDVKNVLKDKELVPEAAVEHASIKELVAQLESDEQQGGEMFDAKIKVLSEYVKHHVKEEEGEMFPKIKQSSIDLVELGARMSARFEDLRSAARH